MRRLDLLVFNSKQIYFVSFLHWVKGVQCFFFMGDLYVSNLLNSLTPFPWVLLFSRCPPPPPPLSVILDVPGVVEQHHHHTHKLWKHLLTQNTEIKHTSPLLLTLPVFPPLVNK